MDLTLVIMAAGMGSRFGGIKQIEPVGPNGEIILDYSVYDAVKAGFNKVVFVIKKELEQQFVELVINKLSKLVKCQYVFQEIDNLPFGASAPKDRVKPWGTAQAVLSCKDIINEPFAVINADDFYGLEAFKLLAKHLTENEGSKGKYCMIGYKLNRTLSEKGFVSRGVCQLDENNNLLSVTERTRIEKDGENIVYIENENKFSLDKDDIVSMNCWGLSPEFFNEIENKFPVFLENNKDNLLKAEMYLPSVVSELLDEGKATVKVYNCNEYWYGFTYKEDKEIVVNAVSNMIKDGKYPVSLFGM